MKSREKVTVELRGTQRHETEKEQKARAERWRRYLDEHNLKPGRRPYGEEQISKYRRDKHRPRRIRQTIEEDRGRYRQRTLITYPRGTKIEKRNTPKKKSGNWETIWSHVVSLRYSKLQERYYLFDRYDEFLGEISQMDLYNLAVKVLSKIGGFREEIHRSRRGYVWIVHTLKNLEAFKQT
jgi:hypothetical protein